MATRIPAEQPNEEEIEGIEDDGLEDDAPEDEGEDGEGEGSDDGHDGPAEETAQEGAGKEGGERRVLGRQREQVRETPLSRANRLAREARAEADRNTRELADIRAELQRARQPPQESPEAEAARLALMEPAQQQEYKFNKAMEQQNRRFAAMQTQLADSTDKATFSSLCTTNPLYKRVAAQVETKLAEVRRLGQNVDREALAKYIIGEMVLQRGPKAAAQQRKVGSDNIRRQQTRPSNGRSDQQNATGDERRKASLRARLEDVTF